MCQYVPQRDRLLATRSEGGDPLGDGLVEPAGADDIDITVTEVKEMLDRGDQITILDVRNPEEIEICRIDGSIVIPVADLQDRIGELDPRDFIVAHCHHGPRSTRAVHLLQEFGFSKVKNMKGGIDSWSLEVDPDVLRY